MKEEQKTGKKSRWQKDKSEKNEPKTEVRK